MVVIKQSMNLMALSDRNGDGLLGYLDSCRFEKNKLLEDPRSMQKGISRLDAKGFLKFIKFFN